MTGEETDSALVDLTRRQPPPTRFRDAGLQRLRLDETFEYEGYYRPFGEVLEQRRTIRAFRQHTLSRDALSGILSAAARLSRNRQRTNNDLTYENYFRSAPSGGARASTELFVHARRIASVPRGNYRYLPDGHALEYVSEASSDDVIAEAMSGQTWFLDCAALIVVAVSLEGSFWKYPARRSYRSVLLDAGHLNQTIYLAATAARIGVGTTAAQRDELWEREMGVSAATHVVALVTGIGPRSTDDPYMAALPRTDST